MGAAGSFWCRWGGWVGGLVRAPSRCPPVCARPMQTWHHTQRREAQLKQEWDVVQQQAQAAGIEIASGDAFAQEQQGGCAAAKCKLRSPRMLNEDPEPPCLFPLLMQWRSGSPQLSSTSRSWPLWALSRAWRAVGAQGLRGWTLGRAGRWLRRCAALPASLGLLPVAALPQPTLCQRRRPERR